ncbi:MAG: RNA polymerase sigma factor [Myxococcota bacterium]
MIAVVALHDDTVAARASALPAPLDAEEERAQERTWVARALEGDARAFRCIVDRHHRGMFRLALRMLGDRAEAEDVVQEAFARAYKRLEHFDDGYRLSTWLYRIALNICRDHLKSPRRNERPRGLSAVPGAEDVDDALRADQRLDRARMAQRLRESLDELSASYREAIVLKDLEELSYQEMKEITGAPVTALKIRVVRARAKLRAILERELS